MDEEEDIEDIDDIESDVENADKDQLVKQAAKAGFAKVDAQGNVTKPSLSEVSKFIHVGSEKPATGFYIDPDTIDTDGKFSFRLVYDANDFNEVEMVQAMVQLLTSDLFNDKEKGSQRKNNFLDFAAQRLRISRDEMERIVSDPEALANWAKNMGVNLQIMKDSMTKSQMEDPDFTQYEHTSPKSEELDVPEPDDVKEDDKLIFEDVVDTATGSAITGGV